MSKRKKAEQPALPDDEPAPIGHNKGPELSALEKLIARKAELVAGGSAWVNNKKIESQEDADLLAGYRKQVRQLRKEADEARAAEVKPLEERVKTIRETYRPIVEACDAILRTTEPIATAWQLAEKARLDAEAAERRRVAEEARRQAEEAERLAAERMAEDLAGTGVNTMATIIEAQAKAREAELLAKEAARAEKLKPKAGGQFVTDGGQKRSETLRTVYGYEINNIGQAVAWLMGGKKMSAPPAIAVAFVAELGELVIKHARKAHTADRTIEVPGVTITESQRV